MYHKINECNIDNVKKQRILNFINAHSHNQAIAKQIDDMDLLAEAPSVLLDIMSLMRKMNQDHFTRMEKLIKCSNV